VNALVVCLDKIVTIGYFRNVSILKENSKI
jgi:hypothetical protein